MATEMVSVLEAEVNQGTYRSLVYPFIYLETENGKAPTFTVLKQLKG